jgi:palmitoyltransferase ZDHHC2/15/20
MTLTLLLSFHLFLIVNNLTTLEVFGMGFRNAIWGKAEKTHNPFNIGRYQNFCAIFGRDPIKWFLPVFSSEGDGCSYPIRGKICSLFQMYHVKYLPNSC